MILSGKVLPMEEILEKMELVDYDAVKEAIDEIFIADNLSFSAVGNINNIDFRGLIENGKKFLYNKD